nr:unnamed protein product [Digitaria exilis]
MNQTLGALLLARKRQTTATAAIAFPANASTVQRREDIKEYTLRIEPEPTKRAVTDEIHGETGGPAEDPRAPPPPPLRFPPWKQQPAAGEYSGERAGAALALPLLGGVVHASASFNAGAQRRTHSSPPLRCASLKSGTNTLMGLHVSGKEAVRGRNDGGARQESKAERQRWTSVSKNRLVRLLASAEQIEQVGAFGLWVFCRFPRVTWRAHMILFGGGGPAGVVGTPKHLSAFLRPGRFGPHDQPTLRGPSEAAEKPSSSFPSLPSSHQITQKTKSHTMRFPTRQSRAVDDDVDLAYLGRRQGRPAQTYASWRGPAQLGSTLSPPLSLSDQWARVVILSSSLPPLAVSKRDSTESDLASPFLSFSSPYKIRASSLPYSLALALPLLPAQRRRQVELAVDELQEPPLSSIRSDRRQRIPSRIDLSGHRRRSFAGGARRREGRSRRRHDSDSDRLPHPRDPLVLLLRFPCLAERLAHRIADDPFEQSSRPPWPSPVATVAQTSSPTPKTYQSRQETEHPSPSPAISGEAPPRNRAAPRQPFLSGEPIHPEETELPDGNPTANSRSKP